MRKIQMIVIHCSATRCNQAYTVQQLFHDHVEVNHWRFIGYHYYIRRSGKVEPTRPLDRMGAHAKGHNAFSTEAQKLAMAKLIHQLAQQFPTIHTFLGHCDLPGVQKACPCFDATQLQKYLYREPKEGASVID